MRVAMLTKEYPPEVYGGAGVHVEFLVRELRRLVDVDVHCFGASRSEDGVFSYATPRGLRGANAALQTIGVDLEIADAVGGADVLHSHTWYANLAGVFGSLLHDIPHVLTAHSLEPLRPWKAEQLGGGYRISAGAERSAYEAVDAVIAVSEGMREDVLRSYTFLPDEKVHVIHNGIDTGLYTPTPAPDELLGRFGIDRDRPSVIFVGRITRQKGVTHLLTAAARFAPEVQLILCAGAPDTPELAAEVTDQVAALQAQRDGVIWVRDHLPRTEVIPLLSHADVFVCPSVYEPLGIVNLEAMACGTAVVASAVGGIPEVVQDSVTGLLVPYTSAVPRAFEDGLAAAVNELVQSPSTTEALGKAGRERAVREFGWEAIAARTVHLYATLAR